MLVLDSVNISNSELKAPRVSPVIFCSETPLGLRKQVFNRNHKLMEKTLPCGSEEVKLALSGFPLSYRVAKAPLLVALHLTPTPAKAHVRICKSHGLWVAVWRKEDSLVS